jgi:molybdate transport system ATP-binding protein
MNKPQILLNNVSVTLLGKTVLSDISFSLAKGEHLRIRGGNGSGKTTFLRLLRGELNQDGGIAPSRLWNFGTEESQSPIFAKQHIALVTPQTQDLYKRRGWNITGFECVATGLRDTPLLYDDLSEEETEMTETAIRLSMTGYLRGKSMLDMSRGETRKIFIARALVSRPDILLLDELLHELDPVSREELVSIAESAAARGTTIVYTSHREDELLPCTVRSVLIDNGAISIDESISGASSYTAKPPHHSLITAHADHNAQELISMQHCDVFIDEAKVLHAIDFAVRAGLHTIIAGKNGAGKSTLLRTLYGWISPAVGGQIIRFGQTGIFPLETVQKLIGYASAELQTECDLDETILDTVLSGFSSTIGVNRGASPEQTDRAMDLLSRFAIHERPDKLYGELSYGQQRKVILARAVVHRPRLVLLDEPMSGLDAQSRNALEEILEECEDEGGTIVMAVHHAEDMPSFTRRIVAMENGRIISTGG